MIFGLFSKKPKPNDLPQHLIFKSNQAAFEYCDKYGPDEVVADHPRAALVEEATGKHDEKGTQSVILRVAGGNENSFTVIAQTAVAYVPPLLGGELVLWLPMQYSETLAIDITDRRGAWFGLIVGVLAPELDWKQQSFRMKIDYRDYIPQKK